MLHHITNYNIEREKKTAKTNIIITYRTATSYSNIGYKRNFNITPLLDNKISTKTTNRKIHPSGDTVL